MLGFMSETTSSSEPATGPVATAAPPPAAPPPLSAEAHRHSRLTAVAAWVGIVAGVVFIVSVVFFSGFILGAHSGGHRGEHHHGGGHHGFEMMHPGGPRGQFEGPGEGFQPPFGPGGPNFQGPSTQQSPQQPTGPTTTAPARP